MNKTQIVREAMKQAGFSDLPWQEKCAIVQSALDKSFPQSKLSLYLDALLKHPGHRDQSVHGNWAHDGNKANGESKDSQAEAHVSQGGKRDWHYASRITVKWGKEQAKELLDKAKAAEPFITGRLQSLAERHGGKMEGLDHRFKSAGSLERKIHDDVTWKQNTTTGKLLEPKEVVNSITDALRYTMTFPEDKFTDSVEAVMKELQHGMKEMKSKRKIQFLNKEGYKGMATIFEKNGQKFELQFHTPESLEVKEKKSHPIYERLRVIKPSDPSYKAVKEDADKKLKAMWDGVRVPKGVERLAKL